MTTIAWDGETIAADSQDTYNDMKTLSSQKLFRIDWDDGTADILATAGHGSAGMVFIEWYEGNPELDIDPQEYKLAINDTNLVDWDDDFHILVWNDDGLFEVDRYYKMSKVDEPFFAVGSGACAALGAMHMGATAKEAVEIAKKIDLYTGGKVKTLTL